MKGKGRICEKSKGGDLQSSAEREEESLTDLIVQLHISKHRYTKKEHTYMNIPTQIHKQREKMEISKAAQIGRRRVWNTGRARSNFQSHIF